MSRDSFEDPNGIDRLGVSQDPMIPPASAEG